MQRVYFTLTRLVLGFPHPLFTHYINFEWISWSSLILKNTSAPTVNTPIAMNKGMIVHAKLRGIEPCICLGCSSSDFRRYLSEKTITKPNTVTMKKRVSASNRPYNASTCHAMVDACSGNNGKSDIPIRAPYQLSGGEPVFRSRRCIPLTP